MGRAVKKGFKGNGVFTGIVKSYDPSSGLFEVVYEDGDSEQLNWADTSLLIEGKVQMVEEEVKPSRVGRKPKKRRRLEKRLEVPRESGNAGEAFLIDGVGREEILRNDCGFVGDLNENYNSHDGSEVKLEMRNGVGGNLRASVEVNGHLNENVNSGDRSEETLELREDLKDCVSVNGHVNKIDNLKDAIDLNAGFNLNLNDACDMHVDCGENLRKRDCIDLNLDVNGDFDENLNVSNFGRSPKETQRRGCDFDLNLEVDECKETECDGGEQFMVSTSFQMADESQMKESGVDAGEKIMEDVGSNGTLKEVHLDIIEGFMGKSIIHSFENRVGNAHSGFADQLKNENIGSGEDVKTKASVVALDTNYAEDCGLVEVQLKDDLSGAVTQMVHGHLGDSGSPCNQRSGRRKRRKLSDSIKSTTATVLRRSTRRGSAQHHVSLACAVDDTLSSPGVSVITEEKPICCKESEKPSLLPPKLQLPPSSHNLNLDDVPVLDVFSVYACLRSFSTLLFLSPFELEDFVAALQFKFPTSLFDNVHVSILQILRNHLEYLSNEGSESAAECLRYTLCGPFIS